MTPTTTPTEVRDEALAILDRMQTMVDNEMVAHVGYIGEDIVRPDLKKADAICGGRNACAVGSLWLAAGVRLRKNKDWGDVELPGVDHERRSAYLKRKPALRYAYDALNAAAQTYIDSDESLGSLRCAPGALEDLFENWFRRGRSIDPSELTHVIAAARAAIEAA